MYRIDVIRPQKIIMASGQFATVEECIEFARQNNVLTDRQYAYNIYDSKDSILMNKRGIKKFISTGDVKVLRTERKVITHYRNQKDAA